ncbi:hypothetical protein OG426_45820 [Streptomyces canus]|uniref:hypothetical protein n=1 Tax=Streptomyces canus TaxID=58343 RepID=UPI00225003FE|nr:hypothetical protein [Streptomyces canus]MCX4855388.1 hypothetical protein [Streptomyces canus]WSW39235.1 hypothetical protein OG426_45820 [Streptomyces canus]
MRYEFRIAGVVPDALTEPFPELDSAPAPEDTRFFGTVTDEAHLYGLLNRFQSLGLHVLEMRELPG